MKKILILSLVLVALLGLILFLNKNKNLTNLSRFYNPKVSNKSISLDITSPKDKEVVSSATVLVKGTTVPNADVFVNDKETKADSQGNFSVSLSLSEGENIINVTVNDSDGNFSAKEITVTSETF